MNKIVIGVDGSAASLRVAKYAAKLAAALDDRMVIAFVNPPLAPIGPETIIPETWAQSLRAEGEALLREAASVCGSTPPEERLLEGPVAETLSKLADSESAELIVVGRGGHGQVAGTVLGSVADRLVQIADRPVLLLPHPARAEKPDDLPDKIHTIVVGIDGSPESQKAIELARGFGARARAKVMVLVHAVAPVRSRSLRGTRWWESSALAFGERLAHGEAARLQGPVETIVRIERPSVLLGRVAEEWCADLLVVGHRGFGGVKRLLVGSVATEVLRDSHRPVLVAR